MTRRRDQRRGDGDAAGPEASPTFADELERLGLVVTTAERTRETIARSNADAADDARVRLRVIACFDCTAPKSCCTMVTGAYLHEGAVLAARLVDEGRDTPALRETLRSAAEGMEASDRVEYARPCAFLGADDRCTVYEERPSVCGVHLVTSPAAACTEARETTVSAVAGAVHVELPRETDETFRAALGLPAIDVPYRGAMPRMVLACLEAWERRDFVAFLTDAVIPAVRRYRWATDA
ncbi:MAG TPA: YkgJ family cysteine cluster protein [Kofleriaceae bacterium]|nr:YkgJ family cysteine cluster protein [Kofleriaceae bacterium]